LAHISLTEVLNKQGPKAQSCGTSDFTDKGDKNLPSMPTKENPGDK
jgi:hypothetical protein